MGRMGLSTGRNIITVRLRKVDVYMYILVGYRLY